MSRTNLPPHREPGKRALADGVTPGRKRVKTKLGSARQVPAGEPEDHLIFRGASRYGPTRTTRSGGRTTPGASSGSWRGRPSGRSGSSGGVLPPPGSEGDVVRENVRLVDENYPRKHEEVKEEGYDEACKQNPHFGPTKGFSHRTVTWFNDGVLRVLGRGPLRLRVHVLGPRRGVIDGYSVAHTVGKAAATSLLNRARIESTCRRASPARGFSRTFSTARSAARMTAGQGGENLVFRAGESGRPG